MLSTSIKVLWDKSPTSEECPRTSREKTSTHVRHGGRKEIAVHFGSESTGRKTDLPTVFFWVAGWHLAKESSLLHESHFERLYWRGIQLKSPDLSGLSNAKVLEHYITLLWMHKPLLSFSYTHTSVFFQSAGPSWSKQRVVCNFEPVLLGGRNVPLFKQPFFCLGCHEWTEK